jgi:hypothetical protein
MRTVRYGDEMVPLIFRSWRTGPRLPYRKTYKLKPGQRWQGADTTVEQSEHYVLLDSGDQVPVGAMIATELINDGARVACFSELWGPRPVFVRHDLICIEPQRPLADFIFAMRSALQGRLAGLPDVLAVFSDGRLALREAKNIRAGDRLRKCQHDFARTARRLFGSNVELAVVGWDLQSLSDSTSVPAGTGAA